MWFDSLQSETGTGTATSGAAKTTDEVACSSSGYCHYYFRICKLCSKAKETVA